MQKPTVPSDKETYTYHYVRAYSWEEAKFLSDAEYVQHLELNSVDMDGDYDDENRPWPEESINISELLSFYETLPKDVLWTIESDYDDYTDSSGIVINGVKNLSKEEYDKRYEEYLQKNKEYKEYLVASKKEKEERDKQKKLEQKRKKLQKLQEELKELEQ